MYSYLGLFRAHTPTIRNVRCWVAAYGLLHRVFGWVAVLSSQDRHPSKNSMQKTICCNSTSDAPDDGRMYPKHVELRIHQYNYLVPSSWHLTIFHGEILLSRTGHWLQYGACALHAGYPRQQTHSEYVMSIAFPLQHLLRERASMSRYTYIACFVTWYY